MTDKKEKICDVLEGIRKVKLRLKVDEIEIDADEDLEEAKESFMVELSMNPYEYIEFEDE